MFVPVDGVWSETQNPEDIDHLRKLCRYANGVAQSLEALDNYDGWSLAIEISELSSIVRLSGSRIRTKYLRKFDKFEELLVKYSW